MITFKITLLIGFCSPKSKKQSKRTKKKHDEVAAKILEKKRKTKKNRKSNKKDIAANSNIPIEEAPMLPKYVILVQEPIYWAHITYELVPKKISYDIDVVCWGPIAKIYSADGKKIITTVTIDDKTWVPICIRHYVENLKNTEIEILREHVVNFTINPERNSLGSEAKSDNPQQFFLRQEDVDKKGFITAFAEDPNDDIHLLKLDRNSKDFFSELKQIILECASNPTAKNPVVSWLNYNSLDKDYLYEVIDKISNNEVLKCHQFVTICPPPPLKQVVEEEEDLLLKLTKKKKPTEKRKEKIKKPKKKGKKKREDTKRTSLIIQVPAEIFFTDPHFSMFQDNCSYLQTCNAVAILRVTNLLTRAQKTFFNPVIIKVGKIYNLPSETLLEQGFSELYLKYGIPRIANCCTAKKHIQKQIDIRESHIFFTHRVPKSVLIKFIQSNRLIVEIHGLRKLIKTDEKAPKIFGTEPNDKYYSNIDNLNKFVHESIFKEDIVIGIVSFDLHSLCFKDINFKEDGQVHEAGSFLYRKYKPFPGDRQVINIPINELNSAIKAEYEKYERPMKEEILLSNNTSLSFECKLIVYQSSSLILHSSAALQYIRMVISTENTIIATDIANILFWNNYSNKNNQEEFITGFIIDEGVNYLFYIEGSLAGAMMTIWYTVETYNEKLCSVYFNADYIFRDRLYSCFIDVGGIYVITLIEPVSNILKKSKFYVAGSLPIHCREAVKKLNHLMLCNNIRCMHQMNLFPSPEELVCLSKEWGVPLDWKYINLTDSIFTSSSFG